MKKLLLIIIIIFTSSEIKSQTDEHSVEKLKEGDIAPNWSLKSESGDFEFLQIWTVKKIDNCVNLLFSLIGMWFYLFFLQHGVLHV